METEKFLLDDHLVCRILVYAEFLTGKLAKESHGKRGLIGQKKRQDTPENGKLPNRPLIPIQTLENFRLLDSCHSLSN